MDKEEESKGFDENRDVVFGKMWWRKFERKRSDVTNDGLKTMLNTSAYEQDM